MEGYIYRITNLVNNKVYIGSSVRKLRIQEHMNMHIRGQKIIKRAILKYGIENFKSEKLAVYNISDRNELYNKEQDYLDMYFAQEYINKENNLFRKLTYNIKPTAKGGSCWKEDRKIEFSIKRKGEKRPVRNPRTLERMRKTLSKNFKLLRENKMRNSGIIYKIKNDLTIIKYNNIIDAAISLNILPNKIYLCCNKERNSYLGDGYVFENDLQEFLEKAKIKPSIFNIRTTKGNGTNIKVINKEDNTTRSFNTLKEAAIFFDYSYDYFKSISQERCLNSKFSILKLK